MERRISLILFFLITQILFLSFANAQEVDQSQLVRFALWAEMDAYPGTTTDSASDYENNLYAVPVSSLKQTAPFILEGMLFGWKFDYVPSDKARNVSEIFDFSPVRSLSPDEKNKIVYTKPWVKESSLWCWIEYSRTDAMKSYYHSWLTLAHPRIIGNGTGKLADGFDGIHTACTEAVKNAVREYERTIIKNKPKEILGTVLLQEPPVIGVDAGRYMVTLDFFMETDRIIEYKKF